MTTIATDGNSMAGDGLLTCGNLVHSYREQKVFLLGDGRIMGICGYAFGLQAWADWLEDPEANPIPQADKEDVEFLVLETDGTCWCYNGVGQRYQQPVPVAVGSGAGYALAAMRAGADPTEAVDIACYLDTKTGGHIITEWRPGLRPLVR